MTAPDPDTPPPEASSDQGPIGRGDAAIPRVVIVGRPNVGKSTLFNALVGRRIAIEDPMAGVTRDRVGMITEVNGRAVELMDTGGIGLVDDALLKDEIDLQISMALDLADLVLFVFDVRVGITPLDREVARRLRRIGVPVVLVANKVETHKQDAEVPEGYRLGFGDPMPVSAKEVLGIHDLRDRMLELLGETAPPVVQEETDRIRVAIVGRMNVGKSTLVNALVGEQRVIVSEVPGTTRDAVDVPFESGGARFMAIDTAGIRKKRTIADSVEYYSQSRAERAVRRADVALLLLDATRDVGRIDRQIGGILTDNAVPTVIVVTKWDLARDQATTADYETYLRDTLSGMERAPIAFISAPEQLNLEPTLALAADLYERAGRRVTTAQLNKAMAVSWQRRKPRPYAGSIGKIYYATQVNARPPTILVFVNDPRRFDVAWRRFLIHSLQEQLGFEEIPLRLLFQARAKTQDGGRT